jgi:hypothetical protein
MSASTTAANMLASDQGYQDEGVPGVDVLQIQKRYEEERAKRLRDDGDSQFVDISLSERFSSFLEEAMSASHPRSRLGRPLVCNPDDRGRDAS